MKKPVEKSSWFPFRYSVEKGSCELLLRGANLVCTGGAVTVRHNRNKRPNQQVKQQA